MSDAPPSLVCPRCRTSLDQDGGGARCSGCGANYPRENGILRLTLGRDGAPGYDPHHFQSLVGVEDRHFWFVARRELILDALRRKVPDWKRRSLFDIGCGCGSLLAFLAGSGVPLAGACDAYVESLNIVREKVTAPLCLVDEGRLPPLGRGQALVGLFDVLEHIDDDTGTLREISSVLEPGGVLALTVPAHSFLFGAVDVLSHHRRRYARGELREKLLAAGFEIRLLTHFMAPLLPLLILHRWMGERLRSRKKAAESLRAEFAIVPGLNALMRFVLRLERYLIRVLPLPFGSSLLAVASRPQPSTHQ